MLLTQLPVQGHLLPHFSTSLKGKWPQINGKTKLKYIKANYIDIQDDPMKHHISEGLKPHHKNLREDIKEEIRKTTGAIINDKNYLMKIADKYYEDKIDFYITATYPLEVFSYFDELAMETFHIECYYHSESDTLFIKQ
jgi:hypothetical protein